MEILFESPRLKMRNIVETDLHDIFELDSNPKVHLYLGNKPIKTLKQAEESIHYILGQYKEYGIGRSAIILKSSGEFIGWSGIKYETEVRQDFNYYDIGYRLKEQYWGKGYATESAKASLEYGFNTLNLEKICAGAEIDNAASNNILTKIGMDQKTNFTFEGTNCHWFELTKESWINR